MIVIGIDPGPRTSGVVWFDGTAVVEASDAHDNLQLVNRLKVSDTLEPTAVVIERVQFYGKIAGLDVFDTLWWSGRFYEAALRGGYIPSRVYWNDIKRQFVGPRKKGDKKVTESDVRHGVLARFGGEKVAKGTRNAPGPLGGVKSHAWSALALAIYWWERSANSGIVPPVGRPTVTALGFE